jgi:2-succinyl-5-enolpyruvyl-6-hydroxy-3-cyclohexene-1-carboxylate synthase
VSHPNASTALARVVVDQLAAEGVRLVVICPGSRSGALAIAASEHPEIDTRVVIDERSAAFHALGAVRASGRPAAVLSTSGTAAANFFPAVVEADLSCVPLIAISADRPAELQGVGANQTVDQIALYGTKVRNFTGIEAPNGSVDRNVEWRGAIGRLVAAAIGSPPGPVHLNVRFREPTVPVADDGRTSGSEYPFETPRLGEVAIPVHREQETELPRLPGERGLVVAGDGDYDRVAVRDLARRLGWPVLATALSGMRDDETVTTYHHLLTGPIAPELRPLTVVAVGSIGPSLRLERLVGFAENRVRVDRWGRVIDPERNATHRLEADVVDVLGLVAGRAAPGWSVTWREAEARRRERNDEIVAGSNTMTGAAVGRALDRIEWDALVVASSLPIREVDAHMRRPGDVFANRGASGIDGFVSTALGVASVVGDTLALAGDLSLLHDSNGFLHDGEIDLTIVFIDNGGGGLFDSLPQASHAPDYERLFVTDPRRSYPALAEFHGLGYHEAADTDSLIELAGASLRRRGVDLIRVGVSRDKDLEMRSQLDD